MRNSSRTDQAVTTPVGRHHRGTSLEIQWPMFLLGADYTGTSCLACTNISDSPKKNRRSAPPHCLHRQLKHGEPLLSVWKWWEHSRSLDSQMKAKGQACKRAFERTAASCVPRYLFSAQVFSLTQTSRLAPRCAFSLSVSKEPNLFTSKYLPRGLWLEAINTVQCRCARIFKGNPDISPRLSSVTPRSPSRREAANLTSQQDHGGRAARR